MISLVHTRDAKTETLAKQWRRWFRRYEDSHGWPAVAYLWPERGKKGVRARILGVAACFADVDSVQLV